MLNSTFNNAEAAAEKTPVFEEKPTTLDPKKAAVAAAIARAKAKKAAQSPIDQAEQNQAAEASNAVLNSTFNNAEAAAEKTPAFEEKPTTLDPKKAAVAAAIARAKAKKAAQSPTVQAEQNQAAEASNAVLNSTFNNAEAAAEKTPAFEEKPTTLDPKKAAVAAAIARAKAKKAAQTQQKLDESQE